MSKLMQTGKPWRARAPLHQGRFDALLRGAGRLLAVVVLAGAAGLLLGIGLAKLTGEDTTSAPPLTGAQTSSPASPASDGASTDSPASTTTKATAATPATETTETISTGGRLRVDVLSTIVRPVASPSGNTSQRARVSVHVRVTNDTGRVVASPQPTLLVGDARLDVANASSQAASPLLRQLAVEAVADGTLRFEAEGALTDQLTMAPIKLRIVGKTLTLAPVVGDAVAPG